MFTIGVDFASQPVNTEVAQIEWAEGHATVRSILKAATDAQILQALGGCCGEYPTQRSALASTIASHAA